tara:strand:- start:3377 stop:5155 length:1779 start_codon:yes stop_codon:yes gene_type:complete
MPVIKKPSNVAAGLGMMSSVMEGYLRGEQTSYDREVELRQYNLQVDMFEEQKSQFDISYEEGVREFDIELKSREDQAEFQREHQVALQDDRQRHDAIESTRTREHEVKENKKERSVQYHRIAENVRMQNLDRSIREKTRKQVNQRQFLGEYDTYEEMPAEWIVGKNGVRLDARDVDIPSELAGIIAGNGSNFLDGINAQKATEMAADYASLDERDREAWAIKNLFSTGALITETNEKKVSGLREMTIDLHAGGDEQMWKRMSSEQREHALNATMHDLNNLQSSTKRLRKEELEFWLEKNGQSDGSAAYGPTGVQAVAAARDGRFFYWDRSKGRPTANGLGGGSMNYKADRIRDTYADMRDQADQPGFQALPQAEQLRRIKVNRDRIQEDLDDMRMSMVDLGYDGTEADKYGEWMFQTYEKEASPGNSEWMVDTDRESAAAALSGGPPTRDDPVDQREWVGGTYRVDGKDYNLGDPGYMKASKISKRREQEDIGRADQQFIDQDSAQRNQEENSALQRDALSEKNKRATVSYIEEFEKTMGGKGVTSAQAEHFRLLAQRHPQKSYGEVWRLWQRQTGAQPKRGPGIYQSNGGR